jgi:hypothetical protein
MKEMEATGTETTVALRKKEGQKTPQERRENVTKAFTTCTWEERCNRPDSTLRTTRQALGNSWNDLAVLSKQKRAS